MMPGTTLVATRAVAAGALGAKDGSIEAMIGGTVTAAPAVEAGVDLLSAGWLTHSATVLDIGLDHRG